MTIYVWGCFSIDAPVPSCLNYCRFRVSPDNWYVFWLSTLFFKIELFSFSFLFFNLSWHSILVYNTLVTLDLLHFLTNLKSAFFLGGKRTCWGFFYWDYNEPIGENGDLYSTDSFILKLLSYSVGCSYEMRSDYQKLGLQDPM